ncbi:hypothetical protein AVEN_214911-1 [Araneus ventricosus]|uniref:Uncharacterized protein n=1 Tax=Araneus ventricosus TaxID=182803 RepID=A0A4Y2QP74_ARAVE|nr:hypothetical protein AVEN_214911-1 [Araneus ventricosus]
MNRLIQPSSPCHSVLSHPFSWGTDGRSTPSIQNSQVNNMQEYTNPLSRILQTSFLHQHSLSLIPNSRVMKYMRRFDIQPSSQQADSMLTVILHFVYCAQPEQGAWAEKSR